MTHTRSNDTHAAWVRGFYAQAQAHANPGYFRIRRLEFELQRQLEKDFFAAAPFGSVLELGCGLGFKSLLWREFAHEVQGIDMAQPYHGFQTAEPSALVGQRIFDSIGAQGVSLSVADQHEFLQAHPEGYDLIFSDYLFEHVPDVDQLSRDIFNALKPGGRTVHIVPTTSAALLELARANLEPSLRDVWEIAKNYAKRWLRGEKRHAKLTPAGFVVPITHSEFTNSYAEQLSIYELERSIFPLMEAGFVIQAIQPIRETSVSVYAAKPEKA